MNDFVSIEKLKGEHGLSLFISTGKEHILFDTGQGDLFLQNAKLLDIDISTVDLLVLSHNHYDHTGGVPTFLKNNTKAKIHAHPKALRQSFSSSRRGIPDSISRKLPESSRGIRKIGFDEEEIPRVMALKGRLVTNTKSLQIADSLWLTGEIPRTNDFEKQDGSIFRDLKLTQLDDLPDDQALIITGKREMAIILGCCHAGVVNTVEYARQLFPRLKVKYIIGGMHLISAGAARINMVVEYLEKFPELHVFHGHCTGFKAGCAINSSLGKTAEFFSVGKRYKLDIE